MRRLSGHDRPVGDFLRGLGDDGSVDTDLAGSDCLLCLGAGLDQPVLYQVEIGPHHNTTR